MQFINAKELGYINELNGLDKLVMYFLLKRPVYNYSKFCETYDVNINELRNEANLIILQNLETIKEILIDKKVNSYSELKNYEDKKEINNYIYNLLRYKIDLYCNVISNNVTVQFQNLKKYQNIKLLFKRI